MATRIRILIASAVIVLFGAWFPPVADSAPGEIADVGAFVVLNPTPDLKAYLISHGYVVTNQAELEALELSAIQVQSPTGMTAEKAIQTLEKLFQGVTIADDEEIQDLTTASASNPEGDF